MAATFLEQRLGFPCIVVGIKREFSKERLLLLIEEHYRKEKPVVAFSHLCGRTDLIGLAGELKQAGFTTILGGPQAGQDFRGEPDTESHPHRFKGLQSMIDIAFQGPVDRLGSESFEKRGLLDYPWTGDLFLEADWSNLYTFSETLEKLDVRLGQVLNAVGCA